MDSLMIMLDKWQTCVAILAMFVASSVFLFSELQQKGLWIFLAMLAPAALVLLWAFTLTDNNETTWISGKAIGIGFFVMVLAITPLPLNITAAAIAVRRSLGAGCITPIRLLPMASGAIALVLLLSAWIPVRRGVKLYDAIKEGKLDIVRSLVHNGKDANREFPGNSGYPLHNAAYEGRASIVALLLEKGANAALKNEDGRTALTALFEGNNSYDMNMGPNYDEVASLLIKAGSPVTSEDMWAVYRIGNRTKTLDALCRRLFTPDVIRGNPPELGFFLETAIQKDDNALVNRFLAAGGDLNFRDAEGKPLIITAMETDNDELAQYLMKLGADVTIRTTTSTIPRKPGEDEYEFEETDVRDYLGGLKESTIRMFFEKAPTMRMDKEFPYTPPLNEAAEKGNLKVMKLLLEKGENINYMNFAKTALHSALLNDHAEAVRFLLNHGADINLGASPDETPLMSAIEEHPNMAMILLEPKWDKRLRLNGRELAKASRFGHLELVKALVRRGADVNAADEYGNTPWSIAVRWYNQDVADYLAAHGADTSSTYEEH